MRETETGAELHTYEYNQHNEQGEVKLYKT